MHRKFISLSLFYFFAASAFAQNSYTVEQWNVVEIKLTSTKNYVRPFDEAEITATFTGPGGKTINRPAFWDGGSTWI